MSKAIEPDCGLEEGFQRLMAGRCPYCGLPIVNVGIFPKQMRAMIARKPTDVRDCELTWACAEGCNP